MPAIANFKNRHAIGFESCLDSIFAGHNFLFIIRVTGFPGFHILFETNVKNIFPRSRAKMEGSSAKVSKEFMIRLKKASTIFELFWAYKVFKITKSLE